MIVRLVVFPKQNFWSEYAYSAVYHIASPTPAEAAAEVHTSTAEDGSEAPVTAGAAEPSAEGEELVVAAAVPTSTEEEIDPAVAPLKAMFPDFDVTIL